MMMRMIRASALAATLSVISVFAASEAAAQQSACRSAVQGKIAWDGRNNRSWTNERLEKLCRGAESSTEPGKCFQTVMSGDVNYGGGTVWNPENALNLCQGSTNASATIDCFNKQRVELGGWSPAIDVCKSRFVTLSPKSGATVTNRPAVTVQPPASAQTGSSSSAERDRVARISCRGPFKGRVYVPNFPDPAQQYYIVTLDFEGISSGNPGPGQCARSGGFDFPQALNAGTGKRMGRLEFKAPYLNNGRRFLNSLETDENGELVSINSNLNGFEQVLLNAMFAETASNFYVNAKWTSRGGRSATPTIYDVTSVNR